MMVYANEYVDEEIDKLIETLDIKGGTNANIFSGGEFLENDIRISD